MRGDAQTRMFGRADLLDGEFDNPVVDGKRPAICVTIPAIENVFRATAQSPYCEIEAERRDGLKAEGERRVRGCSFGLESG